MITFSTICDFIERLLNRFLGVEPQPVEPVTPVASQNATVLPVEPEPTSIDCGITDAVVTQPITPPIEEPQAVSTEDAPANAEPESIEIPLTALYSVSGNAGTKGIGFAVINLSGAVTTAVLTDIDGNYSFSGLAAGEYRITPVLAGHLFQPPFRDVTITDANVANVDFIDPPQTNRSLGLQVSPFPWR